MKITGCRFCDGLPSETVLTTAYFFAISDRAPVNPGHVLLIPKEHHESPFSLSDQEWADLKKITGDAKKYLDETNHPNGYNIGINVGEAAGQTMPHLHIHVIPRYKGDVENPRGGIRNLKQSVTELWQD